MNIYRARALQKALFKNSVATFKRMRTLFSDDGKLMYTIYHKMCDDVEGYIGSIVPDFISRLKYCENENVDVAIYIVTDRMKEEHGIILPIGFYILEFIEID